MEKQLFSTRREFDAQLQHCLARAGLRLQLFDPDFAHWALESAAVDAILRRFLLGQGRIELVAHDSAYLARCARFMRLLHDFGGAIACRVTDQNLRHLTDSFCLADADHLVRRFHCDHMRGEALSEAPDQVQPYLERFSAIWLEAEPGLHASTLGL